jgi:hypothetical protein
MPAWGGKLFEIFRALELRFILSIDFPLRQSEKVKDPIAFRRAPAQKIHPSTRLSLCKRTLLVLYEAYRAWVPQLIVPTGIGFSYSTAHSVNRVVAVSRTSSRLGCLREGMPRNRQLRARLHNSRSETDKECIRRRLRAMSRLHNLHRCSKLKLFNIAHACTSHMRCHLRMQPGRSLLGPGDPQVFQMAPKLLPRAAARWDT